MVSGVNISMDVEKGSSEVVPPITRAWVVGVVGVVVVMVGVGEVVVMVVFSGSW